ncbi:MAG: RsmB/NOP family class I SAM-dependent RNA methyltransferase [Parvibaculum sp.]|uniref:RsmB/NOP family class I SAM-dependent RNA methyltransferase n=1 Tax=Parvibaculum sp. TaxID=2024848 RepID=UPI0025EA798E|nr:RsmB/NOP family class I SAM-dependent RNA methyltransferase [Parvibaculum sp.]MCE9650236.1 RsmB/NOP family class I SAM-dependent RNA methyltransferase [Parvibaculum sp.]
MTPGARLQAAIDILSTIGATRHPADRVFDGWARGSRFAGSKDRAAVGELVFTVLRHKSELATALGSEEPRLLALGAVSMIDAAGPAAAMALADGARHAPAPLEPGEADALRHAALPGEDAPAHVRLNYPEWLHAEFVRAFGPRLEKEMAALMQRAPTDLRVNALKGNRETALEKLTEEKAAVEPTPLAPFGLRLTARANIQGLAAFRDGLVELQDEGSQLACLLSAVQPGEQVADLCAGGGGKSLALAAMMGNRGQIHACDTDRRRLGKLMPRAQRAGARNIQTRFIKPDVLPGGPDTDLADLEARMDCVLIDAPCSGTGAWRRNPDARWRLTPELLASYRATQMEVLARGSRAVRPGGRLVYITCSLLPSENEDQIDAFLKTHPDFVPAAWDVFWPEGVAPPPAAKGGALRLTPASTGTDGFFVAILKRKD